MSHMNPWRWPLSVLAAALLCVGCLSAAASRESIRTAARCAAPPPTTGLAVLAAANDMNKSGLLGEEVRFDTSDFARALCLSTVPSLTVTALPPVTDGELRLGAARITEGQTILGGDLDRLAFVPAHAHVRESAFDFEVGGRGYVIRCAIHLTDRLNAAPTVAAERIEGLCEHMNRRGRLTVTDPEGDATRCILVTPPAHGALIWTDAAAGAYCYRPADGFAGEDVFTVAAVDAWGNSSAAVRVTVRVGVCGVTP